MASDGDMHNLHGVGVLNVRALLSENIRLHQALQAVDSSWTPPRPLTPQLDGAVRAALDEVFRAKAKHGEKTMDGPGYTETQRLAILMEEVGEVAHELTYDAAKDGIEGGDTGRLEKEVTQVAAMALTWLSVLIPGPVAAPAPPEAAGRPCLTGCDHERMHGLCRAHGEPYRSGYCDCSPRS